MMGRIVPLYPESSELPEFPEEPRNIEWTSEDESLLVEAEEILKNVRNPQKEVKKFKWRVLVNTGNGIKEINIPEDENTALDYVKECSEEELIVQLRGLVGKENKKKILESDYECWCVIVQRLRKKYLSVDK